MRGKGAMIWNTGTWLSGNPAAQVARCLDLGLAWVSVKIADGLSEFWRNHTAGLIAALRASGLDVVGWAYTYGGEWDRKAEPDKFYPDPRKAKSEGRFHAQMCNRFGLGVFQIDAEREYKHGDGATRALEYVAGFREHAPDVELSLCSYRHPAAHAPFPFREFAGAVHGMSPQVYFEGASSDMSAVQDLDRSLLGYSSLGTHPYIPIGPTYPARGWRASGSQITAFLGRAQRIGLMGVGVWALDTASEEQLEALRAFRWPGQSPPVPRSPEPSAEEKLALLWRAHPELHG